MTAIQVAFYMHDLSGGGVERMRLALIAALRARSVEAVLVLDRCRGSLVGALPPELPLVVLGGRGTLQAAFRLRRALRRLRPDILVSSLDHNNIAALMACSTSGIGTGLVICQHNALSAERVNGWRYRAVPWLYWLLHSRADAIVAVSHGVADDLAAVAGIPRRRITPIGNPVIDAGFAARRAGIVVHPWLPATDIPVFVFVGRLTMQKNPSLLLDAFARLSRSRSVRLLILGEGPLLDPLRTQAVRLGIAERLDFVGFQANPLPWIAHATCLVLPSHHEGLGNVLIEALACGTQVIATDCPHGPREILQGGAIGRLVPVDDPVALAAAMSAAASITPDPAQLRARAADFTAEACADAHLALFTQVRPNESTQVFGLVLSAASSMAVVERIVSAPVGDHVRLVVTPNIDHVRLLRQSEFRAACRSAELACPDGFPVLLYARLRGLRLRSRVTGCDLFAQLADHPSLPDRRLLVLTESDATANRLRQVLGHLPAGTLSVLTAPRHLAGDQAAQAKLAHDIAVVRPDILVMTLGAPMSETFVHRHRHILPPCWALCVGQAVRVHLGLAARAPPSWQRLGLEWLWRIKAEPTRLAARYAAAFAWFPIAILCDLINKGSFFEKKDQKTFVQ